MTDRLTDRERANEMESALREILFARKPGLTPKLIDGDLIERIEKIAGAALAKASQP